MAHGAPPPLLVCELGTIEYSAAAQLQARLRDLRQRDAIDDVLLVLEHPPVYTRGRRSEPGELPMGEDWYRSQGIEVVDPTAAAASPTTGRASWSAIRSFASPTWWPTCAGSTAICAPWRRGIDAGSAKG